MLKPISKDFLNQSITLNTYIDDRGKISYGDGVVITNVRVDKDHNYQSTLEKESDLFRNIIIVDRVNSGYDSFEDFKLKSKVTHKGQTYIITGVNECMDIGSDMIHHLEVYCE